MGHHNLSERGVPLAAYFASGCDGRTWPDSKLLLRRRQRRPAQLLLQPNYSTKAHTRKGSHEDRLTREKARRRKGSHKERFTREKARTREGSHEKRPPPAEGDGKFEARGPHKSQGEVVGGEVPLLHLGRGDQASFTGGKAPTF